MTWKLEKLSVISGEALADPDAGKALSDWVTVARIVADRRNQIIHSFFVLGDASEAMTGMKASTRGGNWRAQSESIDLASLQEV